MIPRLLFCHFIKLSGLGITGRSHGDHTIVRCLLGRVQGRSSLPLTSINLPRHNNLGVRTHQGASDFLLSCFNVIRHTNHLRRSNLKLFKIAAQELKFWCEILEIGPFDFGLQCSKSLFLLAVFD